MVVFKIVCWTPQEVTTVKRMLGRLGQFTQLEPPKKHILFFVPMVAAETVTATILLERVTDGHILKFVVWNYSESRVVPDEDEPGLAFTERREE